MSEKHPLHPSAFQVEVFFVGFFPHARRFWGSPPKPVRDLICGLTETVAARILVSLGCYHFLSLYVLKFFFVVVIFSYTI